MIPDWPEEKSKLFEAYNNYIVERHYKKLEFFFDGKNFIHHEGDKFGISRSDGSFQIHDYREITGDFSLTIEDVMSIREPKDIFVRLDPVVEDMSSKTLREIFQTFQREADLTGISIDASGKPLSGELFLEGLSRMHIDFDTNGEPIMPVVFVPPGFDATILDTWNEDPEMDKAFKEIMNKKREEWSAREASRKLVD